MKVKICGITSLEDALAAINFGADAVGFLIGKVHHSTSSFVTAEQAAGIISQLPPYCSTVLVTHMGRPDDVVRLAKESTVNTVQLHGDTTPKEALEVKEALPYAKTYKVIHVFDESAIEEALEYIDVVDGIILDTAIKNTGQVGGTGKTHDWEISKKIVEKVPLPVILAGGLDPENVEEAIRIVNPYAVDVQSGVTNPDKRKNLDKLEAFIHAAKSPKV